MVLFCLLLCIFPCEKRVWIGRTWIYLFVAELVKHYTVFSFPPGRSGHWGPICCLKWTLLSVPSVWQIETVVCVTALSMLFKCLVFWEKGNVCRLHWKDKMFSKGWILGVNIHLKGKLINFLRTYLQNQEVNCVPCVGTHTHTCTLVPR